MKLFIFLNLILSGSLCIAQNCDTITKEERTTLTKLVKNDIENWPKNIPDSLGPLLWKVFPHRDCEEIIKFKTDSATYKFDLFSEVRRRTFGGFAGSYPHASSWGFKLSEEEVVNKVKSLIEKNPNITLATDEFPKEKESYWLHILINQPGSDEVIYFWIRGSSIALVSYQNKITGESKLINKDFWYAENNRRKSIFEELIINEIKK